jgi:hypothetical protein
VDTRRPLDRQRATIVKPVGVDVVVLIMRSDREAHAKPGGRSTHCRRGLVLQSAGLPPEPAKRRNSGLAPLQKPSRRPGSCPMRYTPRPSAREADARRSQASPTRRDRTNGDCHDDTMIRRENRLVWGERKGGAVSAASSIDYGAFATVASIAGRVAGAAARGGAPRAPRAPCSSQRRFAPIAVPSSARNSATGTDREAAGGCAAGNGWCARTCECMAADLAAAAAGAGLSACLRSRGE